MSYYTLTMRFHRFRRAIAVLTDQAGNIHEFEASDKRQVKHKVFDFIGKQRAVIETDDPYILSALSVRTTPMNIKIKRKVVRR